MTGQQKGIAAIGIAVIVLVAALIYWFSEPANTPNAPEGTAYICQNDQCKNQFTMTVAEVSEHHEQHYGEPIPCPKCKQTKVARAVKCPNCGHIHIMQRNGICPACKKPMQE